MGWFRSRSKTAQTPASMPTPQAAPQPQPVAPETRTTVGMVGLGKIGLPVAEQLLGAGFPIIGYRRHSLDAFQAAGGTPAGSPQEVAARTQVVLLALPGDDALLDVVTGRQGLLHGAHPGLMVVDLSMLSMAAKEAARAALSEVDVPFLDCPLSGTPMQVRAKKAVILGSGDSAAFELVRPIFAAFTGNVAYLGAFGAGMRMKCVANLLVAIHNLATAEAMSLAAKAGLDPDMVVQVITPSIAGSTMFTTRAPLMATHSFTPPLSSMTQMEESIAIIRAYAASISAPTPLLDFVTGYYDQAIAAGLAEQDVAAVYTLFANADG